RRRRGGRVVEGTPLLRAQAPKGPRGFESHPLRHVLPRARFALLNRPGGASSRTVAQSRSCRTVRTSSRPLRHVAKNLLTITRAPRWALRVLRRMIVRIRAVRAAELHQAPQLPTEMATWAVTVCRLDVSHAPAP